MSPVTQYSIYSFAKIIRTTSSPPQRLKVKKLPLPDFSITSLTHRFLSGNCGNFTLRHHGNFWKFLIWPEESWCFTTDVHQGAPIIALKHHTSFQESPRNWGPIFFSHESGGFSDSCGWVFLQSFWRPNVHTIQQIDLCLGRNHASTVNTAFFGAFVWRPSICPQRTQTLARNGSTMGGGHEQPIEGRLLLNVDLQPEHKWKSWSGIVLGGLRILQREKKSPNGNTEPQSWKSLRTRVPSTMITASLWKSFNAVVPDGLLSRIDVDSMISRSGSKTYLGKLPSTGGMAWMIFLFIRAGGMSSGKPCFNSLEPDRKGYIASLDLEHTWCGGKL